MRRLPLIATCPRCDDVQYFLARKIGLSLQENRLSFMALFVDCSYPSTQILNTLAKDEA